MADGLKTDGFTPEVPYAAGVETVLLLGGTVKRVVLTTVTGVFCWRST